jgi:hypothetical protein
MQTELVLSQETTRQRSIDEAVIKAQVAAQKDYDAGLRDSPLLDPTTIKSIQQMAGATYDVAEAQRQMKNIGLDRTVRQTVAATNDATKSTSGWSNAVTELGSTFSSAFEDAVVGGKNLSDVLQGLEQDLMRLSLRFAENQALTDLFGEGGFGSGGGWLGHLFSPDLTSDPFPGVAGRAAGGPVSAGTLYRVNENGTEFFRPDVDGTVIPMGRAGTNIPTGVTTNLPAMMASLAAEIGHANSNGGTTVQIIDQRGSGGDIATEQSTDATGMQQIKVFIRDTVKSQTDSGAFDKTMNSQYGLKAVPKKRRA